MGKPKYDPPTNAFPFMIPKRLNMLSVPKQEVSELEKSMPLRTPTGVRRSALRGHPSERVNEIAWPQLRRLIILKRMYKNRFTPQRLQRLDSIIEASNATFYTKLANCTIDLKKEKDPKRKRGWTETEWKKHMDYISQIALPKKDYTASPVQRGKGKPLEELLPRIRNLAAVPDKKLYVKESKESGYKNPMKLPLKMGKKKYDHPTPTFPYKISRRLNVMSVPRNYYVDTGEDMPAFTPRGIRQSALRGQITDRLNDAAWPSIRRLLLLKRMYKTRFTPERLDRIDRMIEASNATFYTKLANAAIDLKKGDTKDLKKKRGWSESEWKKHMDYINQIAGPRRDHLAPAVTRGTTKPLDLLMPRIKELCSVPEFKIWRRLSKEVWYRDPIKVSPKALKYVITDNVRKLAKPRKQPE